MAKAKSLHGADIGKIVQNYKGEAFGFDSRNFYSQFVAAREVAGNPDKYFPEGVAYHKPHDHDRLVLRQAMPADQVARHYGLSVYQLDDLNPSWNNAIVQGKARIPAGASVWLPAGTTERITDHPTPGSASTLLAQTEREDKRERDYVTVRRTQVEPEPTLAQAETRDVARGKTSASNKSSATKAELAKNAKGSKLMLAKADTKGKAKADSKAASSSTPAKGQKGAKQVLAKADTSAAKGKDKAPIKTHVVKPNETLFRVAVMYDLSVDELKKLNKMSAKDNTIKAGQRIRVSG